ncbi:MAG: hypothetical protein ACYDCO_21490 [Armatimonadota bacterium]
MKRRIVTYLTAGAGTVILLAAALLRAMAGPPPAPLPGMVRPDSDRVFTSTRYISGMATAPGGGLWVATPGGILHRAPEGGWRKFTRLDGLPSHETRSFLIDRDRVTAFFPTASATWQDGRWQETTARSVRYASLRDGQTCAALWTGKTCAATVTGLSIKNGDGWREVEMPLSTGTHISALLPREKTLWAALYGDGLWQYDGRAWQFVLAVPSAAREMTALAAEGDTLWLGTRREGLWSYQAEHWRRHPQPDEPYEHNGQSLAIYRDCLFMGTLEDGLAVYTGDGWKRYAAPEISSGAPRQMTLFHESLFLRHGSGKVDRFDGRRWERDICKGLPRKEASALAADADRLYVAQWGGWSEYNGREWTHFLKLPELQGLAVTALLPDGDTLWIGTQQRGVAEYSHSAGTLRWHDDRSGLPDDWIKYLARQGNTLYAGTFVGGLACRNGEEWSLSPALPGEEITALAMNEAGTLFIGTRKGLWQRQPDGALTKVERPFLDEEVQALQVDGEHLWVGTRTGLFFLKTP